MAKRTNAREKMTIGPVARVPDARGNSGYYKGTEVADPYLELVMEI